MLRTRSLLNTWLYNESHYLNHAHWINCQMLCKEFGFAGKKEVNFVEIRVFSQLLVKSLIMVNFTQPQRGPSTKTRTRIMWTLLHKMCCSFTIQRFKREQPRKRRKTGRCYVMFEEEVWPGQPGSVIFNVTMSMVTLVSLVGCLIILVVIVFLIVVVCNVMSEKPGKIEMFLRNVI